MRDPAKGSDTEGGHSNVGDSIAADVCGRC